MFNIKRDLSNKRKQAEEDFEHLRQVDLPSGPEFIAQTEKDKDAKQKQLDSTIASNLEMERQRKFAYRRHLAEQGNLKLKQAELDPKWKADFIPTDGSSIRLYDRWFKSRDGIVLCLKSPTGEVYVRAVSCSMQGNIDLKAISTLVTQAENTIDSYKGLLLSDKKTKSGIYL